jgi:hypothetical protein
VLKNPNPKSPHDPLRTKNYAAEVMDVHPATVDRAIKSGRLMRC